MKKVLALMGSLFIFAGVKAQSTTTIKKETVKPIVTGDTLKKISTDTSLNQTKVIKFDKTKKTTITQMKEYKITTKPIKW